MIAVTSVADKSLDYLFHREYDETDYNCAHLVCDAWQKYTGDDITTLLFGLLKAQKNRHIDFTKRHYFKLVERPVTPCIVLMKSNGQAPHVGFYHDSYVMQMTQQGVQNQPLEISTRGFKKISFYRKRL